jgi:hypothetical protein
VSERVLDFGERVSVVRGEYAGRTGTVSLVRRTTFCGPTVRPSYIVKFDDPDGYHIAFEQDELKELQGSAALGIQGGRTIGSSDLTPEPVDASMGGAGTAAGGALAATPGPSPVEEVSQRGRDSGRFWANGEGVGPAGGTGPASEPPTHLRATDLKTLLGHTVWSAWGRPPGRLAEALQLGSELAVGCEREGYRFVRVGDEECLP